MRRGAWRGHVYVLVDNKTTSSVEMFASQMKDSGIAKIVGSQSGGTGCGFMAEGKPLELPNSKLRFWIPNCARLRSDMVINSTIFLKHSLGYQSIFKSYTAYQ
ncbi:S41 family peptidase [Solimicrobium silvestre]|uniref:Peptidase family S41 n=1 Tax=Solimicrobium silvestre TaxID=2099400 RepID=A0A2S9H002_9BURK|nr:Peptidase family S41 [Solimicrobium silvestre]